MKIINPQISGNQVTYDVRAENFINMISMQYTIRYDTSKLSFVAIQNMNLVDFSSQCFNANIPGLILNSWYQHGIGGVTMEESTPIYQIVFEMHNGGFGNVCFSEDPLQSEFAKSIENVISFNIVDDCHPQPFQIILGTSGTEDIALKNGLDIDPIARDQKIHFRLEHEQTLEFRLFNLDGTQLSAFSEQNYSSGENTLNPGASLVPGIYLLTTQIHQQPLSFKIFSY
ncbi:MAG: cohesin domain-containing protein [Saprospiraceae bacterium]